MVSSLCVSNSSDPKINFNTKTTNGSKIGKFTSSVTGLKVRTTYYVRSYATHTVDTACCNRVPS
jgi:hypothetical protein